MNEDRDLIYKIGITLLPDIGDISIKKLISYCGSVRAVFTEKKKFLQRIPGINKNMVESIVNQKVLSRAELELTFITRNAIRPLFYLDNDYPERLKQCVDSPVMLYFSGEANLNHERIIAIVGTRRPTHYGINCCEELIYEINSNDVLIVSGLAYGIDASAHKLAMEYGMKTIGVLAHGLDRIYPPMHHSLAKQMLCNGGLLTDYTSGTTPERQNFPSRNRIVAGMSDAVIVIESGRKGGALITADIANSYSRDVFAVPGRNTDPASQGCNILISENKAGILLNGNHLATLMGWNDNLKKVNRQKELFIELSDDENRLITMIREFGEPVIDQIALHSSMPMSKTAAMLLDLELKGILRCLPGKKYSLT